MPKLPRQDVVPGIKVARRDLLKAGAGMATWAVGCSKDEPLTEDGSDGAFGQEPRLQSDQAVRGARGWADPNGPDGQGLGRENQDAFPATQECGPTLENSGETSGETPSDQYPLLNGDAFSLKDIDAIVVVMMENRSFDHYLGSLRNDALYRDAGRVNGLVGSEFNLDASGQPVTVHLAETFTQEDPPHEWDATRLQWNQGRNDGFVRVHEGPHKREVMGYHDRSQIPFLYWLADNFTVMDQWYSSVMGPTWPNRYYLHAGTANGVRKNDPSRALGLKTLWQALKEKGIPCKNYYAGAVSWFAGGFVGHMLSGRGPRLARIDEFFDDARNGTLPAFSVIDPDFAFNDDHPSHSVLLGQAFLSSVYAALAASPQWNRTLLLITYDEHGGFYDHVPPPACVDAHPDFRHLGFRVPALAVGPSVRRGQVVSTLFEHASVGSTLCARFGLSPLSDRMAAANTLASVFQQRPDISRIRIPKPPRVVIPPVNRWVRQTLPSSQPELETMLDRKLLPLHALDVREMETRRRSWLRYAEELGAVQTQ